MHSTCGYEFVRKSVGVRPPPPPTSRTPSVDSYPLPLFSLPSPYLHSLPIFSLPSPFPASPFLPHLLPPPSPILSLSPIFIFSSVSSLSSPFPPHPLLLLPLLPILPILFVLFVPSSSSPPSPTLPISSLKPASIVDSLWCCGVAAGVAQSGVAL